MKTTISVQVDDPYGQAAYCAMNVPIEMLRVFEPITTSDDPLLSIVSGEQLSKDDSVYTTLKGREDAAKILSETIAEHLVRAMGQKDTHNGYPKGE